MSVKPGGGWRAWRPGWRPWRRAVALGGLLLTIYGLAGFFLLRWPGNGAGPGGDATRVTLELQ